MVQMEKNAEPSVFFETAEIEETAEAALELLKDGNARYTAEKPAVKHNTRDREYFKNEQMPLAVIVTCADSRVGPEIFLDQDLGDVFVIRGAGNVADENVLGSVEYAAANLNVPLIAVIGHSKCGAITAAVTDADGKFSPNLSKIIGMVKSNIHSADVESAVRENAEAVAAQIRLNDVVIRYGVKVVSAYYDIETGVVDWGELS